MIKESARQKEWWALKGWNYADVPLRKPDWTENLPVISELLLLALKEADELTRVSRLSSHQYEKEKQEMTVISSPVEELNVLRSERHPCLRHVPFHHMHPPFPLLRAAGSDHPPPSRQTLRRHACCFCRTFCTSVRRTLLTRFQTICCF